MDFGRPHRCEAGVACESNIALVPPNAPLVSSSSSSSSSGGGVGGNKRNAAGDVVNAANSGGGGANDDRNNNAALDAMLINAANDAAMTLFGTTYLLQQQPKQPNAAAASRTTGGGIGGAADGGTSGGDDDDDEPRARYKKLETYTNSRNYPERVVDRSEGIRAGNLVVIFESFENLNFVYATPGEVFHNRNGHFYHDDFLNKPFGCKIRSRNNGGLGFVYLLRPTAELWSRSLPHRTQIVHELDASMIVFHLHLRPGMVVCESGTGSGAMSHALLRTIAPRGRLHTYEFNRVRAARAREEFQRNGVDHMVTVHHRDVCGKPVVPAASGGNATATTPPNFDGEDGGGGGVAGTGEGGGPVGDGANGPAAAGTSGGFGIGGRRADAIFLDLPEPWLAVPHAAYTIKPNGRIGSYSPCVEQTQRCVAALGECGFHSIKTVEARLKEYYVDDVELESPPKTRLPRGGAAECPIYAAGDCLLDADAKKSSESEGTNFSYPVSQSRYTLANLSEDTGAEADNERSEAETEATEEKALLAAIAAAAPATTKRKKLCARPFSMMRGHTAFLTFATAGLKVQLNPSDCQSYETEGGDEES